MDLALTPNPSPKLGRGVGVIGETIPKISNAKNQSIPIVPTPSMGLVFWLL